MNCGHQHVFFMLYGNTPGSYEIITPFKAVTTQSIPATCLVILTVILHRNKDNTRHSSCISCGYILPRAAKKIVCKRLFLELCISVHLPSRVHLCFSVLVVVSYQLHHLRGIYLVLCRMTDSCLYLPVLARVNSESRALQHCAPANNKLSPSQCNFIFQHVLKYVIVFVWLIKLKYIILSSCTGQMISIVLALPFFTHYHYYIIHLKTFFNRSSMCYGLMAAKLQLQAS